MSSGIASKTLYLNGKGDHTASVIVLHGLGDSGQGISGLAQYYSNLLPHVKFIVPTATNRSIKRFGGQYMNAWFGVEGHADKSLEPNEGIDESVSRIRELLAEQHALGIPYSRIALAGFSQGGAMSLYTGLQLEADQKLAGLLVLSGFLPSILRFRLSPGLEDTRVFHTHGTADTMIPLTVAQKAQEHSVSLVRQSALYQGLYSSLLMTSSQGVSQYDLKVYQGAAHTVTAEMREESLAFLQEILPFETQKTKNKASSSATEL